MLKSLLASRNMSFTLVTLCFPGAINDQFKSITLISSQSVQMFLLLMGVPNKTVQFLSLCEGDNNATTIRISTRPGHRILPKHTPKKTRRCRQGKSRQISREKKKILKGHAKIWKLTFSLK